MSAQSSGHNSESVPRSGKSGDLISPSQYPPLTDGQLRSAALEQQNRELLAIVASHAKQIDQKVLHIIPFDL
jgi:hypothetical protein